MGQSNSKSNSAERNNWRLHSLGHSSYKVSQLRSSKVIYGHGWGRTEVIWYHIFSWKAKWFFLKTSLETKKNIYFSKCKHLIVSDHLNFFPRKKLFDFSVFSKIVFSITLLYVKYSNNLQYSDRPISQSYVAKRGVTCNGLCDITNVT